MKVAVLFAGLLCLGIMSNLGAQTVYKWVDGDGVTHFSERPPRGIKAERTTVKLQQDSYRQAPQTRSAAKPESYVEAAARRQQQKEETTEEKPIAKEDRQNRAENCEKARARNESYSTSRRLYRDLGNGEREYLTDEELDNARAEAQKLVDEWCD